jgi:hypothetical protein
MQGQSVIGGFHLLLAAVIDRAIDDLKQTGPRCGRKEPDRAMAFILSDDCEAYCLELGIDCGMIREKAAALYRQIIGKEAPEKRSRRPLNRHRRENIRQRPGELNRGTYSYV